MKLVSLMGETIRSLEKFAGESSDSSALAPLGGSGSLVTEPPLLAAFPSDGSDGYR